MPITLLATPKLIDHTINKFDWERPRQHTHRRPVGQPLSAVHTHFKIHKPQATGYVSLKVSGIGAKPILGLVTVGLWLVASSGRRSRERALLVRAGDGGSAELMVW